MINLQSMTESYSECYNNSIDICLNDTTETPKRRTAFGIRLLQSRKALGLTQEALARSVGISQATLAKAEYHAAGSSYTPQMARTLKVNPNWLATGEGLRDADAPPPLDLTGYVRSDLSPLGQELGALLDMIPDRINRAHAYSDATQAILRKINASAAPASSAQDLPETPETRRK